MTVFSELYAMAKTCSLSMLVTADASTGKLTVNVLPKPKPGALANSEAGAQEATLTQPLCLTATPEEFDQDFVAALRTYRECHQSLAQQTQATCDLLKAAKDASANKAAAAVGKAQRAGPKGTSASSAASSQSKPHGDAAGDDGDDDMTDSRQEAEGRAADHAPTGAGSADAEGASQPQLFG